MSDLASQINTLKCGLKSNRQESEISTPMLVGKPITNIRKILHKHPEVSREERHTAEIISEYFSQLQDFIILRNVGYHGLVASRKFGEGKTIAFRAELDGLPILEKSDEDYSSQNKGVSHVCGHDGHMSILLSLAKDLNENPPTYGTICFIFQSAEETGEGAAAMIENADFLKLEIDECYALHNIPGLEMGSVHSKVGSFACASVGVTAEVVGRTSHAAHPEDAINPLNAAIELWNKIKKLPNNENIREFALATSIALHSGEKTFGTSPAKAELMVTMRAALTADLEFMKEECINFATKINNDTGAVIKFKFQEYFPATENCNLINGLKKACNKAGLSFQEMKKPFRWSEDFAHFSKCFPILMFGLGSGTHQPALHAPDFDFPEEIIENGKAIFYELYKLRSPF